MWGSSNKATGRLHRARAFVVVKGERERETFLFFFFLFFLHIYTGILYCI